MDWKCEICGNSFSTKRGLINHLLRSEKISLYDYYIKFIQSPPNCLHCGEPLTESEFDGFKKGFQKYHNNKPECKKALNDYRINACLNNNKEKRSLLTTEQFFIFINKNNLFEFYKNNLLKKYIDDPFTKQNTKNLILKSYLSRNIRDFCFKNIGKYWTVNDFIKYNLCNEQEKNIKCEYCNIGDRRISSNLEILPYCHNMSCIRKWAGNQQETSKKKKIKLQTPKIFNDPEICKYCGKTFEKKFIKIHYASAHKQEYKPKIKTFKDPVTCEYCGKICESKGGYAYHLNKCHNIKKEKPIKLKIIKQKPIKLKIIKEFPIKEKIFKNPIACKICNIIVEKQGIGAHIIHNHNMLYNDYINLYYPIYCKYCNQQIILKKKTSRKTKFCCSEHSRLYRKEHIDKTKYDQMRQAQSDLMKQKILDGSFTPCVTNSWANSCVKLFLNGFNEFYRSTWEAVFQILNPSLKYEKIRISYFNSVDNKNRIYIVDFVDEENKILYEIKPDKMKDNITNLEKQVAAEKWCQENNYTYIIISDQWFLENAAKINYSQLDKKIYKGMKQFLKGEQNVEINKN